MKINEDVKNGNKEGWNNGSLHSVVEWVNTLFFCDNKIDSNKYKRMIESEILPFIESHQRIHLDLCKSTLPQKNIKVLPWLPKSPDMNIVEKVWAWISDKVYQESKIFNVHELKDKILLSTAKVQTNNKKSIQNWFCNLFDKVMDVIESSGSLLK